MKIWWKKRWKQLAKAKLNFSYNLVFFYLLRRGISNFGILLKSSKLLLKKFIIFTFTHRDKYLEFELIISFIFSLDSRFNLLMELLPEQSSIRLSRFISSIWLTIEYRNRKSDFSSVHYFSFARTGLFVRKFEIIIIDIHMYCRN